MSAVTALPKVALVGRVNVGKSTLFNRLIEKRAALVSPAPGTTRDRKENICQWRGQRFILVDTGGVEKPRREAKKGKSTAKTKVRTDQMADLGPLITAQTEKAVNEAALILLITDAHAGPLPQDRRWAEKLRGKKNVLLVINKVDNAKYEAELSDFFKLGLGELQAVSGANGRGTGDLLDRVIMELEKINPVRNSRGVLRSPRELSQAEARAPQKAGHDIISNGIKEASPTNSVTELPPLTLAIVGQPNSGKSTLLNAILGEERVITSPIPHTTREPQDIDFVFNGRRLILIDTAGIRRRARVSADIEHQGVSASLKTVNRADVVILVIDALRGPTTQDQRLASYAIEHGKGLILAINKWDLVAEKTAQTMQIAARQLRELLPGLNWAPIIFISAKNKQRINELLEMALMAKTAAELALSEEALMDFLKIVIKKHRPSKAGGVRHPKILSFKQTHADPPRFEVTALGELHPSYLKFLENRLRDHFGFTGAPINITLKTRRKRAK